MRKNSIIWANLASYFGWALVCSSASGLPSLCSSDNQTVGYPSLTSLQRDLTAAHFGSLGNVLTICPNSFFTMDGADPIVINHSNVTIKCGQNGTREEQCALWGGDIQLEITGNGVTIQGLAMLESRSASVLCSGPERSSAVSFQDCEFSGNKGLASIIISQDANATLSETVLNDVLLNNTETNQSMSVSVEGSSFHDNRLQWGTIINIHGTLSVSNTNFSGNSGEATIISTGSISLLDSCFVDNERRNASGTVVISDSSLLLSRNSNGIEFNSSVLPSDDCDGVFALDTSECFEFQQQSCEEPTLMPVTLSPTVAPFSQAPYEQPSMSQSPYEELSSFPSVVPTREMPCISDLGAFRFAVMNPTNNTLIQLCDDMNFELSRDAEPLRIERNIEIVCSGCLLIGGTHHVILEGSLTDVLIRGITFQDAAGESIRANLTDPSFLSFQECSWIENKGDSTVKLSNALFDPPKGWDVPGQNLTSGSDDDIFNSRFLSGEVAFECIDCIFNSNVASDRVIASFGVTVELSRVQFNANEAGKDLVSVIDARSTIARSCFVTNRYGDALVDVDFPRSFLEQNSGQGNSNLAGLKVCDGLGDGVTCIPFDSPSCLATSENSPELQINGTCFGDWAALRYGIGEAPQGVKNNFSICGITTLRADQPIRIEKGDVSITCEAGSSFDSGCMIQGGQGHFIISGSNVSVSFSGINFEGSTFVSIMALGSNDSTAVFRSCKWTGNAGPTVVLVYNEDTVPFSGQNIKNLTIDENRSMNTRFDECYFLANNVNFAAVAIVGGNTVIDSCGFQQHDGLAAGAITGLSGATVSLASSCFVENESLTPGVVFLDSSSVLPAHDKRTFGAFNKAGDNAAAECQDILEESRGSDCLGGGACIGFCHHFEAPDCELPFVIIPLATSSPTPQNGGIQGNQVQFDLELQNASLGTLVVINLVVLVLTIALGSCAYYQCLIRHTRAPPKTSMHVMNRETVSLAQTSKKQKATATGQSLTRIDEQDEERFIDEPPYAPTGTTNTSAMMTPFLPDLFDVKDEHGKSTNILTKVTHKTIKVTNKVSHKTMKVTNKVTNKIKDDAKKFMAAGQEALSPLHVGMRGQTKTDPLEPPPTPKGISALDYDSDTNDDDDSVFT